MQSRLPSVLRPSHDGSAAQTAQLHRGHFDYCVGIETYDVGSRWSVPERLSAAWAVALVRRPESKICSPAVRAAEPAA